MVSCWFMLLMLYLPPLDFCDRNSFLFLIFSYFGTLLCTIPVSICISMFVLFILYQLYHNMFSCMVFYLHKILFVYRSGPFFHILPLKARRWSLKARNIDIHTRLSKKWEEKDWFFLEAYSLEKFFEVTRIQQKMLPVKIVLCFNLVDTKSGACLKRRHVYEAEWPCGRN